MKVGVGVLVAGKGLGVRVAVGGFDVAVSGSEVVTTGGWQATINTAANANAMATR